MMSPSDWVPTPRPVPDELTEGYRAEPYRDPWNSILERIDKATMRQLREMMRGGIGEPERGDTP
jgi:hypothetical protein